MVGELEYYKYRRSLRIVKGWNQDNWVMLQSMAAFTREEEKKSPSGSVAELIELQILIGTHEEWRFIRKSRTAISRKDIV
jgi:hypothetical protein